MSNTNDGGPAFPVPKDSEGGWEDNDCTTWRHFHGMSLRDWFAGQALASMATAPDYTKGPSNAAVADRAYTIADAMLKAREQQ
jgi:hypothetical protein